MVFLEYSESITTSDKASPIDYNNKSNQCGHLHENSVSYLCFDCALYCCKNCVTFIHQTDVEICISCKEGRTSNSSILSRDPKAKSCPECNKMCRHYESLEKTSFGFLSFIKSLFVSTTTDSNSQHKTEQTKHYCRSCALDFQVQTSY